MQTTNPLLGGMRAFYVVLLLLLLVGVIFGCGGGGGSSSGGDGGTPPPANVPPVANAGSNQTVNEGSAVTLDGTGSSDSDGTVTGFSWTQTAGPTVTPAGADTATPSFIAPAVTAQTVLTFALTVTDNNGAASTNPANVNVTVQNVNIPQSTEYVVLAWNDLGMHCLNPTYNTAVVLPPYNTVWAQVIRRGDPPQVVTSGLTVEYRLINNTYSYGKTHGLSDFGQFWDNCLALFGVSLAHDTGLNLVDPTIHNGLSGTMLPKGDHFEVDGIPLTPVDDSLTWNPYQVVEVTVRDSGNSVIAQTQATAPTSEEMNCARCHGANAFLDVLRKHDSEEGTTLLNQTPVLCAKCHGSPALGQTGPGTSGKYLSQAMHGFHAGVSQPPACYDCHPGATTQCSRSARHAAADGNCVTCHGSLSQVGSSIPTRIPWVNEPKCSTCHTGVAQVDTGTTLYRDAQGHGNLRCAACHGSPHAMIPTNRAQASDHYQANQYQGGAKSIGSCGICHSNSRGQGSSEFAEQHGGTSPKERTACNVCHTAVSSNTGSWPHAYQWHNSN